MSAPKKNTTIRTVTSSRIVDADGQVRSTVTSEETRTIDGDGNTEIERVYVDSELADGAVYNRTMSAGKDPVVLTAICGICRREFSKATAVWCKRCGACLCTRDAVQCDDGHRCRLHARRYKVAKLAKVVGMFLFFKKEK
ncbi:MAG: hypothetical protein JW955_24730 [Sedimentisphaerales bacterium]|nr:hypothetical protein [Sedimentisphaerales bacterium]